jgi:hypothetical protein
MPFFRKPYSLLWVNFVLFAASGTGCPPLETKSPQNERAGATETSSPTGGATARANGGSDTSSAGGHTGTGVADSGSSTPDTGAAVSDASAPKDAAIADVELPYDGASGKQDTGALADATPGQPDASVDTYDPSPPVEVIVNSGNKATISVWDGHWQRFYFDAVAGQVYMITELSGIVRGYLSTSPAVSATNYELATDIDGDIIFVAPATQRYYIAVVATGGGVSGSFQVADGGRLLPLGSTQVTLTEGIWIFRFPITASQPYWILLDGPSYPSVGLVPSPSPERTSYGDLAGIWGTNGPLPFNASDPTDMIPADSVNNSKSGFYFFSLTVTATMDITITLRPGP